MRWISGYVVIALAIMAPGVPGPAAQQATVSADTAIKELQAGNARHVAKRYQHPNQSAGRQRELAGGQHPHAAVLACADSRVPPEIVFDQGLGDIFDVRVAGNVAADPEIGSLEYAAEHLHVPVVVVLGHQKCGAVAATFEARETPPGHLPSLVNLIRPAVKAAESQPGDKIDAAVRINVENVVRQLRECKPILDEKVKAGKVKVVGAVYSLDTGKVDWLPASK